MAQDLDLPKNPRPGDCFFKFHDDISSNWEKINCDFKDPTKLKTFQIKLHNLGYDVDVTGKLDRRTLDAYNQYLVDEKKRKKEQRKLNRKNKRANKS